MSLLHTGIIGSVERRMLFDRKFLEHNMLRRPVEFARRTAHNLYFGRQTTQPETCNE